MDVKVTDKQKAAARKEGGKKGQDLSGLEDMGGIHFFHVALESCEGNWELVEEAMAGANDEVSGEERKGGAGNIGKAFLSAGNDRLCIYVHVPEAHAGEIKIQDWFDTLVKAAKAKVIQPPTNGFAKAETIRADEVFPLKLRDEAIGMGFQFLRKAGVVPEVESSEEEAGSYEANYEW